MTHSPAASDKPRLASRPDRGDQTVRCRCRLASLSPTEPLFGLSAPRSRPSCSTLDEGGPPLPIHRRASGSIAPSNVPIGPLRPFKITALAEAESVLRMRDSAPVGLSVFPGRLPRAGIVAESKMSRFDLYTDEAG